MKRLALQALKLIAGIGLGFLAVTLVSRGAARSSITITNPTGGSVKGTVQIEASATGTICSVSFTLDGQSIGITLTNPPWTAYWSSTLVSNGPHRLGVTALDSDGVLTTSSVTVNVDNPLSVPPSPSPSPSPPTSCPLPDPYAAAGGGICVGGQWLAPPGRPSYVPINSPSLRANANVPETLVAPPISGHVELGTVTIGVVGAPGTAVLQLVFGVGPNCSGGRAALTPLSPVSTAAPLTYGYRRLDDGYGLCVVADRSVTLKASGTYLVAR